MSVNQTSKPFSQIYSVHVNWPEQSVIQITTTDNQIVYVHKPFLQHRWAKYQANPDEAIQILTELTKEELKYVLLYIYTDRPGKLSQRPIFERCELKNPASLQDSTFTDDMRSMMNDEESCDFRLIAAEPGLYVPCHRPVLAARSKYFRALFVLESCESTAAEWKCEIPINYQTLKYFVEYLYTGQILEPQIADLIPICWLVKYLRLTNEKEVENIVVSVLSRELQKVDIDVIAEIANTWSVKCVLDIVNKYKNIFA